MHDSVLTAFNLDRRPFDKDVSTENLWLDDDRQEAVDRLLEAVSARRHVLVTGEQGVGKTTVIRALRDQLSPVHYRAIYVCHVTLGPRDFYRQICQGLGVEAKATAAALFSALQRHVGTLYTEQHVHPVIVLDECHLMPDRTLGHLHILANFEWDARPLMSLVLVGLPELHQRLRLGINRSLLTRIATHIELRPTEAEQTSQYVRRRVKEAGAHGELFAPDALAMLHELSGGVLRTVDVLADEALRQAARRDVKLVDRDLVRRAFLRSPLS